MKTLIMLVGLPGAGKTTYFDERLSGYYRVNQDDHGDKGHRERYREALERGEETIVLDRCNHTRSQRGNYIALAKKFGYRIKIVWLNIDTNTCIDRVKERKGHPTLGPSKADEAVKFFERAFQVPSKRECDELEVVGQPPHYVRVKDIREDIGNRRYLVVGDLHGCVDELKEGLKELNFNEAEDVLVCVGDIVDRGPKVRETLEYVMGLPRFYSVKGNHDDKCVRCLEGKQVKITNGLQVTLDALGNALPEHKPFRDKVLNFLRDLPLILQVPHGYVVHAGFDPMMPPDSQQKSDCIYMRFYGGKTYFDSDQGILWSKLWAQNKDNPLVLHGHIPSLEPSRPNVINLDGGCVFGDYLLIWDSLDQIVHYTQAHKVYSKNEYKTAVTSSPAEEVCKREEYVVAGLLRKDVSDDGTLAVFNYTDTVTFEKAWDEITINSRGHIFNVQTGELVALTMAKFFNLNEGEASRPENFDWTSPHWFYEKLDGCLGVLYRHEGKFKVSSRGSFHSEHSQWATDFIQKFDLSCLPDDVTLCFEMITPKLRIILDYGEQNTLVILAAFNRFARTEYPRDQVEVWARQIGLPIVKRYDGMTISKVQEIQKDAKGIEGFVIHFADGRRVKAKTEWYMQLARIYSHLGPISIWESMANGKVQDTYLSQIPEELLPLARQYQSILEGQYQKLTEKILTECRPFIAARNGIPKQIGLDKQKLSPLAQRAVFAVLKNDLGKIDKIVMDAIYPTGNNFVA